MGFILKKKAAADIPAPATGKVALFFDSADGAPKTKDAAGVVDDLHGDTGAAGDPSAPLVINAQTGTTYTVVAADLGKLITLDNAAAITVTVPQTSTETLAAGFWCTFVQRGAGQVTVATQGSDTIESRGAYLKLAGQHAAATVVKLVAGSPNTYSLVGDLTA